MHNRHLFLFFINYVHYVHSALFFTKASRVWRFVNQDQRQNFSIIASEVEGAELVILVFYCVRLIFY